MQIPIIIVEIECKEHKLTLINPRMYEWLATPNLLTFVLQINSYDQVRLQFIIALQR